MARVKRGVTSRAKHKKVLKAVKGQWGRRKNTIRVATLIVFFLLPHWPFTALRTFLCFALLVTPLLTLAILSS